MAECGHHDFLWWLWDHLQHVLIQGKKEVTVVVVLDSSSDFQSYHRKHMKLT